MVSSTELEPGEVFCCVIGGNIGSDSCGVIESLVMKLDGWQGKGSSLTVRAAIGGSRVFVTSHYLEIGREGESCGWGAGEMGTATRNLLVHGQAWKKAEGRGGEVGVALERDGGSF